MMLNTSNDYRCRILDPNRDFRALKGEDYKNIPACWVSDIVAKVEDVPVTLKKLK